MDASYSGVNKAETVLRIEQVTIGMLNAFDDKDRREDSRGRRLLNVTHWDLRTIEIRDFFQPLKPWFEKKNHLRKSL